jgi:hypothetical protein
MHLTRNPWSTAARTAATLLLISIAAATKLQAAPPLPGAVFTTDSNCTGVDLNIYASKDDVYVNGGPAHPGAASLPDGCYYVQVTDPSGATVLGTSVGSGNATPFCVVGGVPQGCYQLSSILIKGSDASAGYDDTPNPGGEYKVWISNESSFTNNSTKTDNFKVKPAPPPPATLCVTKFYDANANGVKDGAEQDINGWLFQLFADDNLLLIKETPRCMVVDPGNYTVTEANPVETNWVHTTENQVGVSVASGDTVNVQFGNVCLGAGGGLTLGFWSNKNGQRLETASDFAFLTSLCLRNASGGNQDFPAATTATLLAQDRVGLNNWLLSANAVNMAYMLSAQLAAMELNVRHGFVKGTALVHTGGCGNAGFDDSFITINDLMAAANAELCAHPYTISGSPFRAHQECLKNALDDANNNKNFVESSPCPFSFAQ